jgi:biofilm PGA synthesis N-glycosyltransferase PgaC
MRGVFNTIVEIVLLLVALWPIVTAALWISGALLYRALEEDIEASMPPGGWPGVTVLVPAFNEAAVIGNAVRAALEVDYPLLEVLVLDDGSTDGTASAADEASAGDPRCRVIRDPVNRGKADRLNHGFAGAAHNLVVVVDADAHLHPGAVKLLVSRMHRHAHVAAVAGMPHVTNRGSLLSGLQILEFSSIVGLIRRTQALGGRVGTIAGVVAIFRRDAVLAVGGYDPAMATEDIELTWRLLLAGWETDFEPHALVGMEVPPTLSGLWAQRRRWARGQGEVLHRHGRDVWAWRNRGMWSLAAEACGSLVWVLIATLTTLLALLDRVLGEYPAAAGTVVAWGIAVAVISSIQLAVALGLESRYDRKSAWTLMLGPIYPFAYWALNAAAAIRSEGVALARGPSSDRVVWSIPREGDPVA